MFRLEDAVTRDIHHPARKGSPDENPDGGNRDKKPESKGPRTDRRVQEVRGIVRHTVYQVENGEKKKHSDDKDINIHATKLGTKKPPEKGAKSLF